MLDVGNYRPSSPTPQTSSMHTVRRSRSESISSSCSSASLLVVEVFTPTAGLNLLVAYMIKALAIYQNCQGPMPIFATGTFQPSPNPDTPLGQLTPPQYPPREFGATYPAIPSPDLHQRHVEDFARQLQATRLKNSRKRASVIPPMTTQEVNILIGRTDV